ncbi:MAPEG family protein [Agarilytica rhodophyticola]|uniref:MAPEG family protein n=1 Tax=Agarilytica rhodophyticola TaxID=1737490 RepID=UPI000B34149A|nr:MAPEG family protein [Agarilytica rhodophyticola]
MTLYITGLYASLAYLIIIFLAFRVIKYRRVFKVAIGSGSQKELDVAIRCHANALENLPLALILLACAEITGLASLWLHLAGTVLIISRIAHAQGLTVSNGGVAKGRFYGTLGTWLTMLALAGFNIFQFVVRGISG